MKKKRKEKLHSYILQKKSSKSLIARWEMFEKELISLVKILL